MRSLRRREIFPAKFANNEPESLSEFRGMVVPLEITFHSAHRTGSTVFLAQAAKVLDQKRPLHWSERFSEIRKCKRSNRSSISIVKVKNTLRWVSLSTYDHLIACYALVLNDFKTINAAAGLVSLSTMPGFERNADSLKHRLVNRR